MGWIKLGLAKLVSGNNISFTDEKLGKYAMKKFESGSCIGTWTMKEVHYYDLNDFKIFCGTENPTGTSFKYNVNCNLDGYTDSVLTMTTFNTTGYALKADRITCPCTSTSVVITGGDDSENEHLYEFLNTWFNKQ